MVKIIEPGGSNFIIFEKKLEITTCWTASENYFHVVLLAFEYCVNIFVNFFQFITFVHLVAKGL